MYNAFSQSLLKKYGWSEGDGLGKNNQGITQPIKANLKFDSHGISYKAINSDDSTKWSNMYSAAVSNLQVENDNCITVTKNCDDEDRLKSAGFNVLYNSFIKSSVYMKDGIEIKDTLKKEKKSKKDKRLKDVHNSECEITKSVISTTNNKVDNSSISTKDGIEVIESEKKDKKRKKRKVSKEIDNTIACDVSPKKKKSEKCLLDNKCENDDKTYNEIQSENLSINNLKVIENELSVKKKKKKSKTQSEQNQTSDIENKKKEKKDKEKKSKDKKIKSGSSLEEKQTLVIQESTFMTCHPSARCGITMSGKLARIQKLHDEEKLKSLSMKTLI